MNLIKHPCGDPLRVGNPHSVTVHVICRRAEDDIYNYLIRVPFVDDSPHP